MGRTARLGCGAVPIRRPLPAAGLVSPRQLHCRRECECMGTRNRRWSGRVRFRCAMDQGCSSVADGTCPGPFLLFSNRVQACTVETANVFRVRARRLCSDWLDQRVGGSDKIRHGRESHRCRPTSKLTVSRDRKAVNMKRHGQGAGLGSKVEARRLTAGGSNSTAEPRWLSCTRSFPAISAQVGRCTRPNTNA